MAPLYGHTASRTWQSDMNLTRDARNEGCTDLASQFIESGLHIDVRALAFDSGESQCITSALFLLRIHIVLQLVLGAGSAYLNSKIRTDRRNLVQVRALALLDQNAEIKFSFP